MTDNWADRSSRGLALATVATPPLTCSETQWPANELPPRPKATRAHRQAIAELGLRFKPANHVDLEEHALRLELLAVDCADLAPGLLRQACDAVAREARFLPSAAEIRAAARYLVEERQRVRAAAERVNVDSDGVVIERKPGEIDTAPRPETIERCREQNAHLARVGASHRLLPIGPETVARVQVLDDGAICPTHVCNGDGTVSGRLGARADFW